MRVWVNGRLLDDPHQPAVPVTDHGLTVGDGVFEAVKIDDGVPFGLTRHLERLKRSASALGLGEPQDEEVRRGIDEVLAGERLLRGRLRITWTAGPAPMGSGRGHGRPTLVVVADAAAAYPESAHALTVPWPRNERGALAGVKTTSYAENVVALAYAHERGASEALFANTQGNVCEGTGSNVFYVVDGEVRTPTLASGCLAGVTRGLLVEWAGVREVDEEYDVLRRAEEVFLASTMRDVQPVHLLDGRELVPGPRTREVAQLFAERAGEDVDP